MSLPQTAYADKTLFDTTDSPKILQDKQLLLGMENIKSFVNEPG